MIGRMVLAYNEWASELVWVYVVFPEKTVPIGLIWDWRERDLIQMHFAGYS